MGKWFTDFSEYGTGVEISSSDWTNHMSTTPTATVRGDAGATGGKLLEVDNPSDSSTMTMWSWNAVGTLDSTHYPIRIRGRVLIYFTLGYDTRFLHGHIGGTTRSPDTYFTKRLAGFTPKVQLQRFNTGTLTTDATTDYADFVADTWHNVLLEIDANGYRAKYWEDGTTEPSTWTTSSADTSLTSGGVGIGAFEYQVTVKYDWFSVGTAGDDAPTGPSSHTDFPVTVTGISNFLYNRDGVFTRSPVMLGAGVTHFQRTSARTRTIPVTGVGSTLTQRAMSKFQSVVGNGLSHYQRDYHGQRNVTVSGIGHSIQQILTETLVQFVAFAHGTVNTRKHLNITQRFSTAGTAAINYVRQLQQIRTFNVAAPGWTLVKRNTTKGISILGVGVASLSRHSVRAVTVLGDGTIALWRKLGKSFSIVVTSSGLVQVRRGVYKGFTILGAPMTLLSRHTVKYYKVLGAGHVLVNRIVSATRRYLASYPGAIRFLTQISGTYRFMVVGIAQVHASRRLSLTRWASVVGRGLSSIRRFIRRYPHRYQSFLLDSQLWRSVIYKVQEEWTSKLGSDEWDSTETVFHPDEEIE